MVRRNRGRIVAVTFASALNYWVLVMIFAAFFASDLLESWSGASQLAASAVVATVVAVGVVGRQVRRVRRRTIADLGAVDLVPGELPVVEHLLDGLALAVGTPPVRAAVLADDVPNALAVGRRPSDTTIIVTTGLVEALTRDELEAVLATELWSIRRLDTAMQTVTVACTGSAIGAHHGFREDARNPRVWLWIIVTWPTMVFAELLRRSVLRHADFGADALAVATTRHPEALRHAIEKLRDDTRTVAVLDPRTAPLWFEPVPHGDEQRARELRRVALTPSLDERLRRVPELPSAQREGE